MTTRTRTATYRIGAVSKLTGLSTHTIRVWERRYGAVEPQRTDGGTREYSTSDLERLLLLKKLIECGHSIGGIARLHQDELVELLSSARANGSLDERTPTERPVVIESILKAVAEVDIATAERLLIEASNIIGPLSTTFDVIAPLIEEIGRRWESGEFRIANEHAATSALRTFLGHLLSRSPSTGRMPVAVAATPTGERHELGLLMAAFVAATRGFDVVYLGPDLPANEILHVVEKKSAQVVLLSVVNARTEETAAFITRLNDVLPTTTTMVVGGRSAHAYSSVLAADQRSWSLKDLYDRLQRIETAEAARSLQ